MFAEQAPGDQTENTGEGGSMPRLPHNEKKPSRRQKTVSRRHNLTIDSDTIEAIPPLKKPGHTPSIFGTLMFGSAQFASSIWRLTIAPRHTRSRFR